MCDNKKISCVTFQRAVKISIIAPKERKLKYNKGKNKIN